MGNSELKTGCIMQLSRKHVAALLYQLHANTSHDGLHILLWDYLVEPHLAVCLTLHCPYILEKLS